MPRRKTAADIEAEEEAEIQALLEDESSASSSADIPGGYSDEMLTLLVQINPSLAKQVATLRQIRARRLQLEAKQVSGFTSREPLLFSKRVLGLRPSDIAKSYGYKHGLAPDSVKVLESLRDNKRTAVPAGHGVGKTFTAGVAALWYLYSRDNTIVVTTAPTWTMVESQLWREIRERFAQAKVPLQGRLLETQIKIGPRHFAIGLSTDEHSKFQGYHGPNGTLVILDEATGVREELWNSAESMLVGPNDRILAIGNPTEPSSRFKQVCDSGRYNVIRLDSENHPNVIHDDPQIIPGAVTREWVQDRLDEYGTKESQLYRSRVSGFWPQQSADTLIPITFINRAQQFRELRKDKEKSVRLKRGGALGMDISGLGDDLTVAAYVEDSCFSILWWHRHVELMETVGKIVRTIEDSGGDIRALAIDDTGIGNGVSSRLIELQTHALRGGIMIQPTNPLLDPLLSRTSHNFGIAQCAIIRVNFAQKSSYDHTKFESVKAEMWWHFRESLQHDLRGLPTDQELANLSPALPKGSSMLTQLSSPIYILDSSGRIEVLDKRTNSSDRQKMLPTKSPDIAHALILAEHAYRTIRAEDTPRVDSQVDARSQSFHKARLEALNAYAKRQEPHNYAEDYDYLQD